MTKPVIGAIKAPPYRRLRAPLGSEFLVVSERATFGDTHAVSA